MRYSFFSNGKRYRYDSINNKLFCLTDNRAVISACSDVSIANEPCSTTVFVELTKKCNLSCSYCYLNDGGRVRLQESSAKEKCKLVLQKLNEFLSKHKAVHIVFFGGEPLMEFNLLQNITDFCDKKIVKENSIITYAVVTNGTLLNNAIIKYLIEKRFYIALSIDGDSETMRENRGIKSMSGLENALEKLDTNGLPAQVIATIQHANTARYKKNLDYLLSLPTESIRFIPCDSVCTSRCVTQEDAKIFCQILKKKVKHLLNTKKYQDIKKLTDLITVIKKIDSKQKIKRFCGYGQDVFAIDQKGCLYPCPSFLGNEKFEITDKNINYTKCIKSKNCKNCIAYSTCHGSCQYTNYVTYQSGYNFMEAKCMINRTITKLALSVYTSLY